MPPEDYPPLTTAQIDTTYNWISYGALKGYCGEICDTSVAVTFYDFIFPLIINNCRGCHSGVKAQKGFHLENYQDIETTANNGKLNNAVNGSKGFLPMPPSGPLPQCEITLLQKWIQTGAPDN